MIYLFLALLCVQSLQAHWWSPQGKFNSQSNNLIDSRVTVYAEEEWTTGHNATLCVRFNSISFWRPLYTHFRLFVASSTAMAQKEPVKIFSVDRGSDQCRAYSLAPRDVLELKVRMPFRLPYTKPHVLTFEHAGWRRFTPRKTFAIVHRIHTPGGDFPISIHVRFIIG